MMPPGELESPARDDIHLVDVLQAIGDPVRLQLVRILDEADGALCCSEIPLPVSKSTGSHHLKVLREAGVTLTEPNGTQRVVSLRTSDLDARFPGLLAAVLAATPATPATSAAASAGTGEAAAAPAAA